jgi:hypothetical protein
MSTTPRTDAEASDGYYETDMGCRIYLQSWDYKKDPDGEVVPADFARQLERELAVANERIANLEASTIHSCHDQCQRVECVLRRKLAEVEKERDEYKYVAATLDDLYVAGQHRIAELEQELAVSKSQFEAMALSFTDKWRRLAELEAENKRLLGVVHGYEVVINRDLRPDEKVRFINLFYARGGSAMEADK